MEYDKPYLTYAEQAAKLVDMGMAGSPAAIEEHLADVGYYRLSGYWHDFQDSGANQFHEGTTFDDVWADYVFDRQFRLLVLDAIERVEIFVRARLAHLLAKETGPFGYATKSGLPRLREKDYERFISKCREKHLSSREPFAVHFREKYGDAHDMPPFWILVNQMDFGQTLTLYRGASVEIRKKIADVFDLTATVLESWLRSLNATRNICAHHGRLWNRTLGVGPMIPKKDARWREPYDVPFDKPFATLTILSFMLEKVAPDTAWRGRLFELLDERSDVKLELMGFGDGWMECPLWKPYIESNNWFTGKKH